MFPPKYAAVDLIGQQGSISGEHRVFTKSSSVRRTKLLTVIMNIDLVAAFEDDFYLKSAAPFVLDDASLKQTTAARDGGNPFAASW